MEPKNPQPQGSIPIPKSRSGGLKGYWNEVVRELKKVDWPPPRETNRLTGVVIAVCGLVIAILFGMSLVADTIVKILQNK